MPGYSLILGSCNPKDSGVALNPNAGLFTSEQDINPSTSFHVVLTRVPKSNVILQILSSNPKEGKPSVSSATFTPTDWNMPRTIGVVGQPDFNNEDGDTPYRIDVGWSSTGDKSFQNLQPLSVHVTNINVVYPLIYRLENSIITSQGGVVNITGDYFTAETRVIISSSSLKNGVESVVVDFISPLKLSANVTGYFTPGSYLYVTVQNPNGASTSCPGSQQQQTVGFPSCIPENQLYVTTGCPAGTFGDGIVCKPCPSNAECPGGGRVWPTPGSWSPNEQTPPVECFPQEGCSGGRNSNCGQGYEGDFCALCEKGFYKQGPMCRSCQDGGLNLDLIVGVAAVFAAGIAAVVIVSPSRHLFTLASGLLAIQEMVQMGLAGSEFIDVPRKLYVSLSWLLLDFNFVRPGCDVPTYAFPQFYIMTILVIAITMGLFICCSAIRALFFALKGDSGISKDYMLRKFADRIAESFTMLGYIVYFLVTTRSFQLINCKRVYNEEVMKIEMASVCYIEEHLDASILAWIVVIIYVVGYPTFTYFLLRARVFSDIESTKRLSLMAVKTSNFLLEGIRQECYWYRGVDFFRMCFVCIVSVFVTNIPLRIMLLGCLALVNHTIIVLAWPFASKYGTVIKIGISFAKIAQCIGLISYYNSQEAIAYLSSLSILCAFMMMATSWRVWKNGWTLRGPQHKEEEMMTI
eukprot:TRINITY_DN4558_c0_g2_i1.p1 TRINITY_DN4558_c0_g2~~TRINITY_DN4558_c0_g2_i1.p1  ORF type:complete len:691 (-),score=96.99 TRINITY_DN4558_c0_g2_i1:64-2136(-)